jgi:hypothetical protein
MADGDGLTSPDRASATTAPRLPAADRQPNRAFGRPRDLPVPVHGGCGRAGLFDHAGSPKRLRWRSWTNWLPVHRQRRHPELVFYRGSMAGLHVPLPTLRRHPGGCLRTARGRCGSLFPHRSGLAPPTSSIDHLVGGLSAVLTPVVGIARIVSLSRCAVCYRRDIGNVAGRSEAARSPSPFPV